MIYIDQYRSMATAPLPNAWFDASDLATIMDTGGRVDTWIDKTGNGHDMSSSSAERPLTGTRTVNGLNVVEFDGTHAMDNASPWMYALADTTVFAVVLADTAGIMSIIGEGSSPASSGAWFYGLNPNNGFTNGVTHFYRDDAGSVTDAPVSSTFCATGTPMLVGYQTTATTRDLDMRGVGRETQDTYSRSTTTMSRAGIGCYPHGGGTLALHERKFDGVIAEILVYDSVLSPTDYAAVVASLKAKWGLFDLAPAFRIADIASTSLASTAITNPTGSTAGDLVMHFCCHDNPGATNLTASTGWQSSTQQVAGSNIIKARVFARILDGSGDDTCTITGAFQDHVTLSVMFPAGEFDPAFDATDAVSTTYLAGASSASSGNPNPPNLNTGASREYLWLALGQIDPNTAGGDVTGNPTNYALLMARESTGSGTSRAVGRLCVRALTASAEDPGTFPSTSRPWIAMTAAIPGAP